LQILPPKLKKIVLKLHFPAKIGYKAIFLTTKSKIGKALLSNNNNFQH